MDSLDEISNFETSKYSTFHSTTGFEAPELKLKTGVINMHKAIAYACGRVAEAVTKVTD